VPDDPESLKVALAQARGEAQQYLDHLRRERADFTNFRRRVEEDRVKQADAGTLSLLLRLLPIMDDFERALGSAQPQELAGGWGQGVQLIERNFRSLLAAEGVERIEAQGAAFNPWEHEAVSYQPTAEGEDGTVMHVIRPGYRKGDRVIRPAQVVVGRASENAKV
jgi:molecular chaperone GrpE